MRMNAVTLVLIGVLAWTTAAQGRQPLRQENFDRSNHRYDLGSRRRAAAKPIRRNRTKNRAEILAEQ
jgi:hypothetical protein